MIMGLTSCDASSDLSRFCINLITRPYELRLNGLGAWLGFLGLRNLGFRANYG